MRATTVSAVSRVGETTDAIPNTSPGERTLRDAALDYHIAYAEYDGRIVVDITPPQHTSGTRSRQSMWSSLQRIHMSSDAEYPELTLQNGRVIRGDFNMFVGPEHRTQKRLQNPIATATPAQRATALRGKIASFLRVRAGSTIARAGFVLNAGQDATDEIAQTWSQVNQDFDVVSHRTISPSTQSSGRGMKLALDVSNVVLTGTPAILP